MNQKETTSVDHCTAVQLKDLLALAAESTAGRAAMIRAARDGTRLRRLLDELGGTEGYGRGLLAAICSEQASVDALRVLKERAKTLREAAPTEEHRAAAVLAYHLAVASAYARHGEPLSSRAIQERWGLYEDLAATVGDPELAAVFEAAVRRLAASGFTTR